MCASLATSARKTGRLFSSVLHVYIRIYTHICAIRALATRIRIACLRLTLSPRFFSKTPAPLLLAAAGIRYIYDVHLRGDSSSLSLSLSLSLSRDDDDDDDWRECKRTVKCHLVTDFQRALARIFVPFFSISLLSAKTRAGLLIIGRRV